MGLKVMHLFFVALALFLMAQSSWSEDPRVLIKGYRLELIAEQPQIVTPVSIDMDAKGRLLVVENHTHQRPDDYVGPSHDRIRRMVFENGKLVHNSIFYDGMKNTMSVLAHTDIKSGDSQSVQSVFVATRSEIFRLDDPNDDGVVDTKTTIMKLDTEGDYPHNGLSGLCFDDKQQPPLLYFGMGENLGAPYSLVGSDGKQIDVEGDGGIIFRCQIDGSKLERFAVGFWNPFGNCVDPQGRLFSVDNDPDASPPCRLNHVAETGDYGYQFRYGRSGRHPLQTWTGDLPGTLGMAAGTGEAPCEIVPHQGRLWVTSWGDHRIERYRVVPNGAGCIAERELVVQGSIDFRPVGLAVSKTGEIYFSDWVDRSYPVHGKGRIWRLTPTSELETPDDFPELSPHERVARNSQNDRIAGFRFLDSEDPYLRQVGVQCMVRAVRSQRVEWSDMKSPNQRIGFLQGSRWVDPTLAHEYIDAALQDSSVEVQLVALRIIADDGLQQYESRVLQMLERPVDNAQLLSVVASVALWLDNGGGSKDRKVVDQYLANIAFDAKQSTSARNAAISLIPDDHDSFKNASLERLLQSDDDEIASAAIRVIALRSDEDSQTRLRSIVGDDQRSSEVRADAVAGLVSSPESIALCEELESVSDPNINLEAKRNLAHFRSEPAETDRPSANEIDKWLALIESASIESGEAGAKAGRRVFFRSSGGQCAKCHRHQGRGSSIGPDLTQVNRREAKRWLLESILQPSKEISPKFMPVAIIKDDGTGFSGLEVEGPGEKGMERFLQANGSEVSVPSSSIESRHQLQTSIMPSGFEKQLSVAEVADLVAFLMQP